MAAFRIPSAHNCEYLRRVRTFLSTFVTVSDFPDTEWTFPWTVNNQGMQGDVFSGGSFAGVSNFSGYVTIYGYPYEVHSDVYGMNDKGQIVGDTRDPSSGRIVGYVATLPK
jgi:hypothetical protein